MAPSRAPHCADWRLTRAVSSCCAGSQLPQGKAPYCGLGLLACAEICAFTFGLRLSSEPNFSPSLCWSPPWPRNQPFLARLQIFFGWFCPGTAWEEIRYHWHHERGSMKGEACQPLHLLIFYYSLSTITSSIKNDIYKKMCFLITYSDTFILLISTGSKQEEDHNCPKEKPCTAGWGCACAEICAFTLGLRLSSEPNFSPRLRRSPPWPRNQPFLVRLQIFFGRSSQTLS
ncbi:uncharacterized protein ACOB8E_018332 isoform 2-T2 [Sarcophilus harrisii]